jgi:pre-mRNA-splicing factor ATP-dependent RNA helicase DHX38/PRP16
MKFNFASCDGRFDVVRKAVCSAHFYNSFKIKGIGVYMNMLTGTEAALHPSSALVGLGYVPDYVVCAELVLTSKNYMRTVTAVDAIWLAQQGPMFFSVKESYESRLERRKSQRKLEKRMEADFEERQKFENDMTRRKEERKRERARKNGRLEVATPGHGYRNKPTPRRRFGL